MKQISAIGYWAAVLSAVCGVGYAVAQLLSWLDLLVHPHELFWVFLPSLFLAPAFLIMLLCLHYAVPPSVKIWTAIGVAFGTIYCAFATLNYFAQLTVIVPALLNKEITESHVLIFRQGSFMFAMDCLGYFFMSFSSLAAAMAFRESDRNLFWWMLVNGLLVAIFIAAYFHPFYYYLGSPWVLTFTMAMMYAAKFFRKHKLLIAVQAIPRKEITHRGIQH